MISKTIMECKIKAIMKMGLFRLAVEKRLTLDKGEAPRTLTWLVSVTAIGQFWTHTQMRSQYYDTSCKHGTKNSWMRSCISSKYQPSDVT